MQKNTICGRAWSLPDMAPVDSRCLLSCAQLKKAQKVVSAVPAALHSIRDPRSNATSVVDGAAAAVAQPVAAAALPAKVGARKEKDGAESSGEMTADVEQLLAKIPSEFRCIFC